MLGIGAGSSSGLSSGSARSIAGTRGTLPRSSRSRGGLLGRGLARLRPRRPRGLSWPLARSLHLGRDDAHGFGSRDLVEKALKVDLHVGDGKTKQVVGLIFNGNTAG